MDLYACKLCMEWNHFGGFRWLTSPPAHGMRVCYLCVTSEGAHSAFMMVQLRLFQSNFFVVFRMQKSGFYGFYGFLIQFFHRSLIRRHHTHTHFALLTGNFLRKSLFLFCQKEEMRRSTHTNILDWDGESYELKWMENNTNTRRQNEK